LIYEPYLKYFQRYIVHFIEFYSSRSKELVPKLIFENLDFSQGGLS